MSRRAALDIAVLLVVWEILGRFKLVAHGALPAPSEIVVRFIADFHDYPHHVAATLSTASIGFIIGNLVALLAGILFVMVPATSLLARGINITLFAMPPIAVVPLLVVTLDGTTARILLAALACYFPTMTATVLGLTRIDARAVDVVRAYGGSRTDILRLVQLRSALPAILGGLRIAAPGAVLGAILAEFGGGGRWGLGAYLLGSLGRADPARLWGIGLTATAIAALAYAAFAFLALRATGEARSVTMPASAMPNIGAAGWLDRGWPRAAMILLAALLPLALWWWLVAGLPEMIAKSPAAILAYLFTAENAPLARSKLIAALWETIPVALVGMAAGIAFAFILAVLSQSFAGVRRILLPIALVTQTMPLVALTPLLVLLFGRGTGVMLVITVSVTFFPAFVTIAQGLALVPKSALDVARAYGGNWWSEIRLVGAIAALPYLFAAARLAAPRALLGVMIAEWLATGTGLGNLLNQSRGYLDYGMIWSVAVVSVLVAILFYIVVSLVEDITLKRMGMG
jgi:ABC-type nitrate/sulfonate/bicarbonate transport system permease component